VTARTGPPGGPAKGEGPGITTPGSAESDHKLIADPTTNQPPEDNPAGRRERMLSREHLDMLAASGITPEHAELRGYETISDPRRLAMLGIAKGGQRTRGLLLPQLRVDGSTWGHQYRPDHPRERNGKVVKYETPTAQRNGIDVPPGVAGPLGDPSVPLFITEDVKKADCGAIQGLCIVALSGVWCWRGTNGSGGRVAVADWNDIALNGRRVIIAFDGDVARKPSVQNAMTALANYLQSKGARVEYLHLPDTDAKTGLDDFLMAGHTVDELWRLVKPLAPPRRTASVDDDRQNRQPAHKEGLPPVDGEALFADIEAFVGKFLALANNHYLVVLVLWIVHTWTVSAYYVTPRLVLDSPEPGSAKTRVLEILALLCSGAKLTLSTTTAALYRRIDAAGDAPPTILQDEADAIFTKSNSGQTEDLRALFNSGYKRGATVDRCEGDRNTVREFAVFAPAALAGLVGKMPKTITGRAITIHMRRRAPHEKVAPFRERDAATEATPIKERINDWAAIHLESLTARRPEMPDGVDDRPAEIWEPLLAVADEVGGEWPERARGACEHFIFDAAEIVEPTLGIRLLRDVKAVFDAAKGVDRMFSAALVRQLVNDPELGWDDMWGKPLTQSRLAKELKRYGIEPKSMRIGEGQARGYRLDGEDGLAQAWSRYLVSAPTRPSRPNRPGAGQIDHLDENASVPRLSQPPQDRPEYPKDVPSESPPKQEICDAGTAGTAGTATNGVTLNGTTGKAANALYRIDLCHDCGLRPNVPGLDRCAECQRSWLITVDGYDR
jgi:hypothetical protein